MLSQPVFELRLVFEKKEQTDRRKRNNLLDVQERVYFDLQNHLKLSKLIVIQSVVCWFFLPPRTRNFSLIICIV